MMIFRQIQRISVFVYYLGLFVLKMSGPVCSSSKILIENNNVYIYIAICVNIFSLGFNIFLSKYAIQKRINTFKTKIILQAFTLILFCYNDPLYACIDFQPYNNL